MTKDRNPSSENTPGILQSKNQVQFIRKYFDNSYPGRTSWSSLLFRNGETERILALKGNLPDLSGLSVLIPGCGDGRFISEVLQQKPAILKLEDLVQRNIDLASSELRNKAESLHAEVTDSTACNDSHTYDVVIAIGFTDYYRDWPALLAAFQKRTASLLLIDFPKSYTLHGIFRKIWIGFHHLSLHATSEEKLRIFLQQYNFKYVIIDTPINWLVKIAVAEKAVENTA